MKLEAEPIILVAVAIPMVLNVIPRNRFYGFRTRRQTKCGIPQTGSPGRP